MCDYNRLSQTTVQALPVPVGKMRGYLGPMAHNKLLQVVKSGRARPGHDFHDGRLLPNGSLARGHYLSPGNFQRALARMNAQPHRCQWCGRVLPASLVRQHQQPHNHREEIRHHFHPNCWEARLVAIAIIFGHVRPTQLLVRKVGHKVLTLRKTVTWTVQKVSKVRGRSRTRSQRRWRG